MRLTRFLPSVWLMLFVYPCFSDELKLVEWGGHIIVVDRNEKNERESATFDVKLVNVEGSENYKITMIYNDQDYLFEKLEVKDGKISFQINTGSVYDCGLRVQEDGSYYGDCTHSISSKKKILMTMSLKSIDNLT